MERLWLYKIQDQSPAHSGVRQSLLDAFPDHEKGGILHAGFFDDASDLLHHRVHHDRQLGQKVRLSCWIHSFCCLGAILFLHLLPEQRRIQPQRQKILLRLTHEDFLFSNSQGNPFLIQVTFLITWASDQAVSFVIPIKDFAYTICFYTSDVSLNSVKNCLSSSHIQGAVVTYIVAILPLLLRMIQCYRQAKQQSGKFAGHLQMWNFFKYMSSVLTATVSYLSTIFP